MKKLKNKWLLIITVFWLLCSCSLKDAEVKLTNNTNYNVYCNLLEEDYIIPGKLETGSPNSENIKVKFSGILFSSDDSKTLTLNVQGETYELPVYLNEVQDNTTEIEVKAGETYKAFFKANKASIKIMKTADNTISQVVLKRYEAEGLAHEDSILSSMEDRGEFLYYRVPFSTEENLIYYNINLTYDSGQTISVTDTLMIDEQLLIISN